MTTGFQEGLGLQKKAATAPKASPYQNLNIKDFVGLSGSHEPTAQERLLMEIEHKKQQLIQEENNWKSCGTAFKEGLKKLQEDFESSKSQMSQNLLELAFFLAREIVDYELSTQPVTLSHSIQKLLDQSLVTETRTLHLNPQDHLFIKEKNGDFLDNLSAENISVLEDSTLTPGCIRITSASRQLETDFHKRLLEIKKQIPGNFLSSFINSSSSSQPGGDHA